MQDFLTFFEIIIALVLVIVILMQVRGQGGGVFGSAQTTFRTRRGVERTLFRFTIILAAVFVLVALFSVRMG
ncbi:MAG: preprotein translocase subunit SecG [Chloroflexi bacterium]|nr:preprotein translocase subunit SecG [Chloroflexota bacterium]MCZ6891317.1 preprotein translocase subunit SecG [Chloroflexota bacterium]